MRKSSCETGANLIFKYCSFKGFNENELVHFSGVKTTSKLLESSQLNSHKANSAFFSSVQICVFSGDLSHLA